MTVPKIVINLGSVALGSDPVFGLLVFSEDGWVPFSIGTPEQKAWVRAQVSGNPLGRCLTSTMTEELMRDETKEAAHA